MTHPSESAQPGEISPIKPEVNRPIDFNAVRKGFKLTLVSSFISNTKPITGIATSDFIDIKTAMFAKLKEQSAKLTALSKRDQKKALKDMAELLVHAENPLFLGLFGFTSDDGISYTVVQLKKSNNIPISLLPTQLIAPALIIFLSEEQKG